MNIASPPKNNNDKRHVKMRETLIRFVPAICCGLIGYIIGSMPNNNLQGHVDVKCARQAVYEFDNDLVEKDVLIGVNRSRESIIEEIVPPTLQSFYQDTQFNPTRSMLRQSRPVIGNTQRLHSYLGKLRNKECTTVLFLGGSVTGGHNVGGEQNAYPKLFMDWLNEVFPCASANGTTGKHVSIKSVPGIKNSQTAFLYYNWFHTIDKLDLVLCEFNVNDAFLAADPPHRLENQNKSRGTFSKNDLEYNGSAFYFEVLLRRLLLLRKPDPIAIVTFNADYIGEPWIHDNRMSLFRKNMEPLKLYISSMYEVPVFSAVSWMLPMAGKQGIELQIDKTYEFGTGSWHTDKCCHPNRRGHKLLSLVIAFCLLEEERALMSHQYSDRASIEQDFTANQVPIMRDPLYLSTEEDEAYVTSAYEEERMIDFTNPDDKSWQGQVPVNEGWTWYADNKFNDKYGLIANNSTGESHVTISLTGSKNALVEISYVISYENFGRGFAWLDDSQDNNKRDLCKKVLRLCRKDKGDAATWRVTERGECKAYVDGADVVLDGIWKAKASVDSVTILREKLPEGQQKYLHICLSPPDIRTHQGADNKFKLLSVRTF